jgi:hypothetical protein
MTRHGMEPSMRYKLFGRHTGLRVSEIRLGFPHDMLAAPAYRDRIAGGKRALLDPPAVPVR